MERDFIVRAGSAGCIMQMMFAGVVRLEETGAGFFLPPSLLPPAPFSFKESQRVSLISFHFQSRVLA